ncbi:NAD+ synthase [Fusobacterium nucleatum subsp. nucleatum ATCC 23726]|mgnify:FL=1|uniref:NH(3)-dependent NAD(+) synthetase n=4 Tax=Fusobacterium nucleatum subsp. nucleatum TaxID=76856 RepID=NADE_FUSNN|nr:NAD+ synthase [Fusobacterium nucleatum]Q8REA7.1 RecName: Full=NH(3)-dependent NAD(+) synthetase [Fusobacterium nucleatum subsp. nucleatum ATCC 25586]AAL95398.1 NH(3)-dependent NAD(+) synthetase [Fusobacterium nucleatum subsp. nucleatum ATCC 25586]ALF24589.1 NAD synthetase [Fusobacterium nucleatum subsp. nucleatum ChDC F316]ASG26157.1 NAD(+) synthetase [Fusobacterium nucleatum subsp. nucleatum]AVQ15539.1 NAD(+) synthetase [Fusobacterium nucleatum subsp. nucleatum ATCC 25586]AVQ23181.1 NAD(+
MNKLDLNLKEVHNELVEFLRENFKKAGFSKAVLGLSGGIDSALVAYLLRDALGKENVLAIMMPYKSSNPDSLNHAKLVVEDLKINSKTIEITDMIDAYFKNEKEATSLRMGNKMARERMSILFDYSSKENALVVGTSNKTEIYLGYSTQFGDAACALNPIGDLYKTNIWDLSRYLKIPNELIEKKPSADLWEGQTDEQEMGLTYKEADQVMYRLLEENKTVEEVLAEGFNKDLVDNIVRRMNRSEYKRRMPLIAKIKR